MGPVETTPFEVLREVFLKCLRRLTPLCPLLDELETFMGMLAAEKDVREGEGAPEELETDDDETTPLELELRTSTDVLEAPA